MASKPNGITSNSSRKLTEAAFSAYLRIAMRKHALPSDLVEQTDPTKLTDIELEAAVTVLKDLAHLPPG